MVQGLMGIFFFSLGFILHKTYTVDANIFISIIIGGLASVIGGAIGALMKPLFIKKVPTSAAEAAVASEVFVETSDPITDHSAPSGIGGWLWIFVFGIIFSLIRSVLNIYGNISFFGTESYRLLTNPDSSYYSALMLPTLVIETALITIQCLMILYIFYLGFKHKKLFKYICISFIVYNIIINTVDTLMASQLQRSISDSIADDTSYTDISRSLLYAAIWIPYFLRSKRVKNTSIH
ncbi:DUF2569 domain-containing protein [Paenibacillus sp. FSL P4-0338]|uniref:DUF2569 domain-containing protein n=1 Tax=unclassified Paenibacillus TaxID=185978 RepID=UPI0003E2878B|nr:DUF2569 domain-containing protein [Paenibacillus sp. FSL R7-269]ETT39336.1 hypothetical protein C162_27849 [Paenibacillus sp. FSL R7-269]